MREWMLERTFGRSVHLCWCSIGWYEMVYMGTGFIDGKGTVSLNRRQLYNFTISKTMQVRRLTNTIKEGRTMMVTTMLMMGMQWRKQSKYRYRQKVMR